MNKNFLFLAPVIALFIASCGNPEPDTAAPTAADQATQEMALPSDLFRDNAPADAVSVTEARAEAEAGERITLTGYIGGRVEPFTEGRAIFLLADSENAPACTDECSTPWDACCTSSDQIAANSATIQVVDAEGKLLPVTLKGKKGLEPGATVTVAGTIQEANDAVLIISADTLAVAPAAAG